MPESKYKTFVSCGAPYTESQRQLVDAVEDYLQTQNCEIFTVGKHNHSARQPVEFARDLISTCDSAVVIAFERYRINDGTEKPGSDQESAINGRSEPTVWNHLEAAMAYANRLPILVLVDRSVKRQGMLSKRFEWNAMEIDVSPDVTTQDPFRQMVADWLKRVDEFRERRTKRQHDLDEITIGEFISGVKAKQAWAMLVACITVLAAVAGAAFWMGQTLTSPSP